MSDADSITATGDLTNSSLSMNYVLLAFTVSICMAVVSEGINWYLIYRHDDYKKLAQDAVEAQEKVDKELEKITFSAGTQSIAKQKA